MVNDIDSMEFQTMRAAFLIAVLYYSLASGLADDDTSDESTENLPFILEDWTFKSVMGKEEILRSFLNDIVVENKELSHLQMRKIDKVQLRETTPPKSAINDQKTLYNTRVWDTDGNEYLVEMQRARAYAPYLIERFQLYGASALCHAFHSLAKKERDAAKSRNEKYDVENVYAQLPRVIVIVISEDPIPPDTFDPPLTENQSIVTSTITNLKSQCLQSFVYLDLSRVSNNMPTTNVQKWGHFLKNTGNAIFRKEYEKWYEPNTGIASALSVLRRIREDPQTAFDLQRNYDHIEDAEKAAAKKEKMKVAKNLLNEKISPQLIAKVTGLTEAEVEQLKQQ